MGYAILRTQKLKSGIAVRRSLTHAFRERETPNADASRTPDNTHIGAADVDEALAKFNERLATQDKVRKNAVLAVEYLITASPEDMHGKTRQEQDAYFRDALKWVEDKHGKANVVYAGIHRDEQTPHMYAYVVPIDQRGKLNCRSFLGGAKALTQMQTEFAQEVGQQHGLQRGIEGSKARHTSIQQYYNRVSKAFEPLPEVKTIPPKVRPEPEKPGLFAGSDAKEAYRLDHDAWAREKAVADRLIEQRKLEVKAQRDAAVETAKRHQAQAKEAAALKAEVGQLKQSNGVYAKTAAQRKAEVVKLLAVAELFTPEEIRAAQARKQQQEAEKARLAELTRSKAAEVARVASIEAEAARRVQGVQKLLQRGGAEHTFGVRAATALREAGGDASRVDWKAVETRAVIESMGRHGQSAENVTKALLAHSPLRADPASHAQLRDTIKLNAPQLEAKYQQDRATRDRDSGHRPR
jgi:hypothetical protein